MSKNISIYSNACNHNQSNKFPDNYKFGEFKSAYELWLLRLYKEKKLGPDELLTYCQVFEFFNIDGRTKSLVIKEQHESGGALENTLFKFEVEKDK
jgi:hypothetical protein